MRLLIDDIRDFDNTIVDIIARTPEAARKILPLFEWEEVYYDHDLGDYDSIKDCGYGLIKWMFENNIRPKIVYLVTSNPVGRDNMVNVLIDNGYIKKDPVTFHRP